MPPEWWNASAESFTVVAPHASRFILSGMPQSFAPHVPKEFPADAAVLEESVRHASQINLEGNQLQQQQWNRVAQIVAKRRQLRVAVLGCSTSVGCGSADPSSKCDASRGWPRLFHDELQYDLREQLPGWKYSTQTRVTAKNAVDPTYFAQCTTSFVDESTHIVMVEFFTNLFGVFRQGNHTGLDATIEAIRLAAPNAAIVFVVWLKELSSHVASHLRSFIEVVAKRQTADVVDMPRALLHIASHHKVRPSSWYAKGGRDHHPNGPGHWLIAKAASRLLTMRLAHASPGQAVLSSTRASQSTDMYCGDCARSRVVKKQECYNRADQLPLARAPKGSWTLVDEGGDKGVTKLGYVSTVLGDAVDLQMLPSAVCSLGTGLVRLGYHLSTRPGQGALRLSCTGCSCKGLQGILGPVSPFPVVQTDVLLADPRFFSVPGQTNGSLSVTASTSFSILPLSRNHSAPCVLRVEHQASRQPRSERSRVRLDSLAVMTKCPQSRGSAGDEVDGGVRGPSSSPGGHTRNTLGPVSSLSSLDADAKDR